MTDRIIGIRRRGLAPLIAGAALFGATGLVAQQGQPVQPDSDHCVCAYNFTGQAPRAFFRMNRARLGVMLGSPQELDGRTGIELQDVEDGGPAERAGLRAGDVLLSLDGQALGDEPAERIVELLGDVEPGDTVSVGYQRDGREQTARIVTERATGMTVFGGRNGDMTWTMPGMDARALRERLREAPAIAPSVGYIRLFGGGLDLVDMNEGLGQYFGVDEGVLVTEVDEDSSLGLRAGDVIVSIGDREVRDAGHARSIIGSYRPDEEIRFEVVRDKRHITVTGTRSGR